MRTEIQSHQAALPLGNLDAYLQFVDRIPLLDAKVEHELSTRLYHHNDLAAAKSLITANLRFVVQIAKGYLGYGLALGDLIQEGNIGLMKAVKRFDPGVGVRLVSFAVHWIKAEIHEFIIRNWRIVKIATTKAQRKLFFNLRRAKKRLGWFNQEEIAAVASDLGVTPRSVQEMENRLHAYDASFSQTENDSEDHQEPVVPETYLKDDRYAPDVLLEMAQHLTHNQDKLHAALAKLDARSKIIIAKRWLSEQKATLQELATEYGVSSERIRQLEENAMKKLRVALESH